MTLILKRQEWSETLVGKQTALLAEIFTSFEDSFPKIQAWRRYLHEHPELSFQEVQTAAFIEEKLQQFGLTPERKGQLGITALVKGAAPGPTIALRADFDALPIQEENQTAYRSQNPGVMHACGHDGHTAALLGVAEIFSQHADQLQGNILFVFQPAEELPPGGAKFMIEEGILADVDLVFAAHLASEIPLGQISVGAGPQYAAVDKFEITIKGKGGHGARPQQTVDALVVGTTVVENLQKIVSRKIDPLKSAVVTVGVFQAGNAFNVIPETAQIAGTVRTFDPFVRQQVEEELRTIVSGITNAFHADYELDYLNGYPALFNPEKEAGIVREIFAETFTPAQIISSEPTMGAEDFAYFLQERPGTYFKVGSRTAEVATQFPHHHPRFDIDEQALLQTEKAFAAILAKYLF